jgi:hypothetical protein
VGKGVTQQLEFGECDPINLDAESGSRWVLSLKRNQTAEEE